MKHILIASMLALSLSAAADESTGKMEPANEIYQPGIMGFIWECRGGDASHACPPD